MPFFQRLPPVLAGKHKDGRPILLDFRSDRIFIVATISLAIFTDIFLYGLIVPVMPFALTTRAHVAAGDLQRWTSILVAFFGIGLFVASPIFGYYADHSKSRRAPLLMGLVALIASTAMFAVARSIALLAVARLLQGASGAVIWTVGLALIVDTVEPEEVAQMMGYVQIGMSFGILLGPLLGGIIYDKAGYLAVFCVAFGVIGLDVTLRLLLIEKKVAQNYLNTVDVDIPLNVKKEDEEKRFQSSEREDSSHNAFSATRTGEEDIEKNISSVDLAADNKTAVHPTSGGGEDETQPKRKFVLPPVFSMLASARLLSAFSVTVMLSLLMTSFDGTLPLHTIDIFDFSSIGAGLMFLPIVIPSLLGPIAGWLIDRYGPRWFVVIGLILGGPVFIFLRFPDHDSPGQIASFCAILAGIGTALVLPMPGIMGEFMAAVVDLEKQRPGRFGKAGAYGQSYALFNIAWALGGVVGPLYGGLVRDAVGWNRMALSLGVLSSATGVLAAFYTGGKLHKEAFKFRRIQREATLTTIATEAS